MNTCPHCGGYLLGDGVTTPIACERVTTINLTPDSGPHFCSPDDPDPDGDRDYAGPAPYSN